MFWPLSGMVVLLQAWSLSLALHPGWQVWAGLAAMTILSACLTVTLERSLNLLPMAQDWRYRLSCLSSAGLVLALMGYLLLFNHRPMGIPVQPPPATLLLSVVFLAAAGAFSGALFNTGLHGSLWEDNSPPTAPITDEVYRLHQLAGAAPLPEQPAKRLFDLGLAALGLLLSAPIWLLSLALVWFEDPGPILFVKNSVGKGGHNFRQFKIRTMIQEAESDTGPVLARAGDERVLLIGRFLRKTALDELPQLINIFLGEMSFVGPRPQRTVLVHGYLQSMPEYAHRHRVLPGLAGLAQVAGDYYLSPRQKLRFDRLYIRYRGLGFDLKLLCLAFLITFWYRWRPGWHGRLPRSLLRLGSPPRHDQAPFP